jgi:fructose-1,6-bisphosphatase I
LYVLPYNVIIAEKMKVSSSNLFNYTYYSKTNAHFLSTASRNILLMELLALLLTYSLCSCHAFLNQIRQQTALTRTRSISGTPARLLGHSIAPTRITSIARATSSESSSSTTGGGSSSSINNKPYRKKKLQTFARYLEVECWKRQELRNLEPVLLGISSACKQINRIVQRAQTDDLYGVAFDQETGLPLEENVQGEVQQQLDVLTNVILMQSLCGCSDAVAAVASEEESVPRCCIDVLSGVVGNQQQQHNLPPPKKSQQYVACFDPLDGSKNIDSSLPVGTIFGIYRMPPGAVASADPESFLLRGDAHLVAAGYCLYSATTVLVLSLGSGVDGFTLDPDTGLFLHTHRDIRIPSSGNIYSFNEAHVGEFDLPVQKYLESLKSGNMSGNKRSNARYIGSLVADVHNILINGGIFGYPSTTANPNGKLRLLYESVPMAMIMEQAGGAASTAYGRILDICPSSIHQRVPTFLGSIDNVFELDQFHKYYDSDKAKSDDGRAVQGIDYYIQHMT